MIDLSKMPSLPRVPTDYNRFTLFSYLLMSLILMSVTLFFVYKLMRLVGVSDTSIYTLIVFASFFALISTVIAGYNEAKEAEESWKNNSEIDLQIKQAQLEQIKAQTKQIKKFSKK